MQLKPNLRYSKLVEHKDQQFLTSRNFNRQLKDFILRNKSSLLPHLNGFSGTIKVQILQKPQPKLVFSKTTLGKGGMFLSQNPFSLSLSLNHCLSLSLFFLPFSISVFFISGPLNSPEPEPFRSLTQTHYT